MAHHSSKLRVTVSLLVALRCRAEIFVSPQHGLSKIRVHQDILKLRGGRTAIKAKQNSPNVIKKNGKKASASTTIIAPAETEHREVMSSSTAVFNVLADLCPHGMLPIGMLNDGLLGENSCLTTLQ